MIGLLLHPLHVALHTHRICPSPTSDARRRRSSIDLCLDGIRMLLLWLSLPLCLTVSSEPLLVCVCLVRIWGSTIRSI